MGLTAPIRSYMAPPMNWEECMCGAQEGGVAGVRFDGGGRGRGVVGV